MNCEHYQLMLSEFLDSELASEKIAPLIGHLAECGSCRETLHEFVDVRVALRSSGYANGGHERHPKARYRDARAHSGPLFRRWVTVPVPAVVLVCTGLLAALIFIFASAFTGKPAQAPQKNVYVITEPIEVRGYYSTQMQRQQ